MLVSKWGNALAVRLPASVVKALGLKEGDEIELHLLGERDLGVARKPDFREALKQLDKYQGLLPKDFRFDRDEAHERGHER
jgi:antitoxin MazE